MLLSITRYMLLGEMGTDSLVSSQNLCIVEPHISGPHLSGCSDYPHCSLLSLIPNINVFHIHPAASYICFTYLTSQRGWTSKVPLYVVHAYEHHQLLAS